MPAGTIVGGSLVVENATGSAAALRDPHGCQPSFAVALTNTAVAPGVGFSLPCINKPMLLVAGVTHLPIEVITACPGCSNGVTVPSSSRWFPRCLPHGGPPGLPAGAYHAVLIGLGLSLPPASVPVMVTGPK